MLITDHAPTGIMCCWNNGNGLSGNVYAIFQAALIDGREMLLDKCHGFVRNIQIDTVTPKAFHLMVNSACHYVSGSKLFSRIKLVHESGSVW